MEALENTPAQSDEAFQSLCDRLQQEVGPFLGLVEYGNLRYQISVWENSGGSRITNLAVVYETPGGSTDQINISYDHAAGLFSVIDEAEHTTPAIEEVLTRILPRILTIPEKRRDALRAEIRRQADTGIARAGLFGQITRLMQSDFKGGTITHKELQEAMRFAMEYTRNGPGGSDPTKH